MSKSVKISLSSQEENEEDGRTGLPEGNDEIQYVVRNGRVFEKRKSTTVDDGLSLPQLLQQRNTENTTNSFSSRIIKSLKNYLGYREEAIPEAPDREFCSSTYMKLSRGVTAYRLIEPALMTEEEVTKLPLTVMLHGLYSSSYMWADLADLMMNCDHGPNVRSFRHVFINLIHKT